MVERGGTPKAWIATALAAAAMVLTVCCASPPQALAATRTRTVIGLPTFALPPTSWGCTLRTPAGNGSTTLPVTVSKIGSQVAILTNICIDGSDPLPFVIDTGASESNIDPRVAARLDLPTAGAEQKIEGVGCTGPGEQLRVDDWSWEGVPLTAQVVWGVSIPAMGGPGQPVGLLGSDVLSRFGAVRFDFAGGTVTVPGHEGPAQLTAHVVQGPTATPTPQSLLSGTTTGSVPAKVITGPGLAEVLTDVRVGGHRPMLWAVDTGSSQSVVARSAQRTLGLRPTNVWERQTTVCSTITVHLYRSGPWAVGAVPLVRGPIATVDLGPVGSAGFIGLLGSDQLAHFSWVVFDYAGGRLVLGAK